MKNTLICLLILCFATYAYSQNISNITVQQRVDGSQLVDVMYTLEGTEDEYNLTVEVSLDNGLNWEAITNLQGDVGMVAPGNRSFIWNAGIEKPGQYTDALLQLTASDNAGGTGAPCPGLPTVTDARDGKTYNTVHIGNQCWLKENMNYNTGTSWCYNNDPVNCDTYGRLYNWETAMTACPAGWHLPTDDEWKILEGTVDSQYGVGDPEWDGELERGFDAGKNLKSATVWNGDDLFGFSALPAGSTYQGFSFDYLGNSGYFWTSSAELANFPWARWLDSQSSGVTRYDFYKVYGFSVRCLKD